MGDHKRHNRSSLVVWICRTLFPFPLSLCVFFALFALWFLRVLFFPLALPRGLMMMMKACLHKKKGLLRMQMVAKEEGS